MQIIKYPHPTLRHKSKPLRRVDAELRKIVSEMFELMYAHKGLGLAANQVDLPYRLFILNITGDPAVKEEELVFINPVITSRDGQGEDREGCLSFPEIYAPVRRSEKVVVNAYDLSSREIHLEVKGLFARAVQHEADHLDGKLFIDRLTPANRLAIKRDLEELEREFLSDRRLGLVAAEEHIAARLAELEAVRT